MATTYITLSTKGQVIIPAEMREDLHLIPGTKLAIRREGDAIVMRPITDEFIESLHGCTEGMGLGDLREELHRSYKSL